MFKELIRNAACEYGFNLEFRTKAIFEQNNYTTESNKLIRDAERIIEIDVIAEKDSNHIFIVECKGANKDSHLILIKEPQEDQQYFSRNVIANSNYRITGVESSKKDMFCTFTGDFFHHQQQKLKKTSKNDSENNFYKAQAQLLEAVSLMAKKDSKYVSHVSPIIVTNAKIWVVDYQNSSENHAGVMNYKWVFHKTQVPKILSLEKQENREALTCVVPIVNVEYLNDFLLKSLNTSTGRLIAPLESIEDSNHK